MQEKEPVRVLVTAPLGVGGVTNMMINIQSHLDRSKVNFDYLVFHDRKEALEDKVASMGSRKLIASVDHISVRPLRRLFMQFTKWPPRHFSQFWWVFGLFSMWFGQTSW